MHPPNLAMDRIHGRLDCTAAWAMFYSPFKIQVVKYVPTFVGITIPLQFSQG
jgi:hypothetical protein